MSASDKTAHRHGLQQWASNLLAVILIGLPALLISGAALGLESWAGKPSALTVIVTIALAGLMGSSLGALLLMTSRLATQDGVSTLAALGRALIDSERQR